VHFDMLQILVISTVIVTVMALLLFPKIGLKFKKLPFVFAPLYGALSMVIFYAGFVLGLSLLMGMFWAALGGGQFDSSTVISTSFFTIAAGGVLANFLVLKALATLTPELFEARSTVSMIGASILVLAVHGGCLSLLGVVNPIGPKKPRPLFGYIDKTGKFVIPPTFGDAEKFHDGKATVWPEDAQTDFIGDLLALNSYPVIDKSGKVIESVDEKKHLAVREKYKLDAPEDYLEDQEGQSTFGVMAKESGFQTYSGMRSDVSKNLFEGVKVKLVQYIYYIYVDKNDKPLTGTKYRGALRYSEGLAAVCKKFWGYIDKQGNYVIKPRFAMASPFKDGLACVALWYRGPGSLERDELNLHCLRYGYIDKTGRFVIPPIFTHAYSFSEGLAAAQIDTANPPDMAHPEQIFEHGVGGKSDYVDPY